MGVLQFLIYNSSGEIPYSEEYVKAEFCVEVLHSILLSCGHLKNSLHSEEAIFLHLSNEKKNLQIKPNPKVQCFSNCRS